jgi:hypothetical protein
LVIRIGEQHPEVSRCRSSARSVWTTTPAGFGGSSTRSSRSTPTLACGRSRAGQDSVHHLQPTRLPLVHQPQCPGPRLSSRAPPPTWPQR